MKGIDKVIAHQVKLASERIGRRFRVELKSGMKKNVLIIPAKANNVIRFDKSYVRYRTTSNLICRAIDHVFSNLSNTEISLNEIEISNLI